MTEQDQIKALAELDGCDAIKPILQCAKCETEYEGDANKDYSAGVFCAECRKHGDMLVGICHVVENGYKDYLTSYDAIIPLIQKWCDSNEQWDAFIEYLWDYLNITSDWVEQDAWKALLKCSPSQLAEALLRATGKWKE